MEVKNAIGGFIAGAAIGVATGLLLAPQSGEKTRKKLLKGSVRLKNDAVDYIDEAIDALRIQLNEKVDQVARRGKDTINNVSEKIKI